MKKIVTLAVASGLALILSGCGAANTPSPAANNSNDPYGVNGIDVSKACKISKDNSIETVLGYAQKFNPIAVKEGVEFMRFGMPASEYISQTENALKAGEKEIVLLSKGKPTKDKVTVEYASERACKFAITSLVQKNEARTEWRLAVPGDGYTY